MFSSKHKLGYREQLHPTTIGQRSLEVQITMTPACSSNVWSGVQEVQEGADVIIKLDYAKFDL
ncbi:hypothetical protein PM082_020280 [Marasmius tenuissimus]|nr:hypothetical protein PM082_020280 [Marasmius tenuissimus]